MDYGCCRFGTNIDTPKKGDGFGIEKTNADFHTNKETISSSKK